MDWSITGFLVLHHLPEFAQTHIHWVSDAIQPSLPLSSPSPPAYNLSKHQVFPNELALHIRWPKFWSLSSASVLPVNIQGLFPLGLTDLLAVQGTLKSLPQHQSLKASVLQCSAFFMVQLSIHTRLQSPVIQVGPPYFHIQTLSWEWLEPHSVILFSCNVLDKVLMSG